ncbi:hypothetical protein [Roseateles violae]|uniref:Outer membrane protein n=1 Tax=Roseateles violae TaxID=3058042 RepID=A0ABT8DZC3_9BURK|nr:hypothetical protein [Pelomonas sp. PFR6]MDN3922900.1 hypothetical protein [Pelomonas sp. PFR6]
MKQPQRPARPRSRLRLALAAAAALTGLAAAPAGAQSATPTEGPWRFAATLYVYLPSVDASTTVPADGGGGTINFDITDKLKFMLMGSLDAHNGRWGGFSDLVYLNLGKSDAVNRDFTIGNIGLPVDTAAQTDWDLKGFSWTLAGQYRLLGDPAGLTLDALGGSRLLDIKSKITWALSGSIGNLQPAGRNGSHDSKISLWDGIVGVKGRYAFGPDSRWSVPLYADVGAGQSKLTYQLAGGLAYHFSWGEASLLWRYLKYEMKAGDGVFKDLEFNGPMMGATWRW